jgi:transcriptional regulator with XRE-family HTH domain
MEQMQSSELLGATVAQALRDADISVRQVAAATGISLTTLLKKLHGLSASSFTVPELYSIAGAIGRPMSALIPAELLA